MFLLAFVCSSACLQTGIDLSVSNIPYRIINGFL